MEKKILVLKMDFKSKLKTQGWITKWKTTTFFLRKIKTTNY